MEQVFIGLLTVLLGLSLVFWGYQFARIVISIWGGLAGLSIGGALAAGMSGTPFLGTTLGILVGVVLGLIFAIFAYLYYSVAVIVLGVSFGYMLGSGLMALIGLPGGLLSVILGIIVGGLFGVGIIFLDAPRYILIGITAVTGAIATIGGLLVTTGQIPLGLFYYPVVRAVVADSAIWTLLALALAAVGIYVQTVNTRSFAFEAWGETETSVPPTTTTHRPKEGTVDGQRPH